MADIGKAANAEYLNVEELYCMYKKLMYKEAYAILSDAHLAEDAVHESFVRVIKNMHKLDLNNCQRTRGYLVSTCRNVSKDIYKKNREFVHMNEYMSNEDAYIIADPQEIAMHNITFEEIMKAIKMLDFIYRESFILIRVHGFTIHEVSEKIGISPETLKKRLLRAKKKIIKNFNVNM